MITDGFQGKIRWNSKDTGMPGGLLNER